MWTCSLLKQNAKRALYARYWRCFGVCLLLGFLGLSSNDSSSLWSLFLFTGADTYSEFESGMPSERFAFSGTLRATGYRTSYGEQIYGLPAAFSAILTAVAVIALVLALCWGIFLLNPLTVGRARYFMESRQAPAPVSTLFSVFDSGYLNIVKVQLLTALKVFAGSLLIIPGIYWSFCYRLVPYLLAENPYLTTRRAMELSKQMMEGEKWHSFVLGLSFIGWDLLAGLTPLGLGGLFLSPYYQATFAELYAALRSKAFAYGMSDANELGGFVTHDLTSRG